MLTEAQRWDFDRAGLLHLPGAIAEADVKGMCELIWEHVRAEHGIERSDPATWVIEERLSGLQKVARQPQFASIGSPAIRSMLDGLLGQWTVPGKWGGLLVTFPRRDDTPWDVPFTVWHNDFMPGTGARAIQIFVLLNDIQPRGGATVVLTGSHHLVAKYAGPDGPHPKPLRKALADIDPWLRGLWTPDGTKDRVRRYMLDGAEIDDVKLRVVELTGSAGDVYFMHCDTFHSAAPNCRDQPRMMATNMISRPLAGADARD